MCAPVFVHSRCTRIRIEKPLSVYYSYVSTVGKSGYIKKKRSSNYFREIIIQSRNFSTIRVYTRIRYIRVERSTPVPIRLNARFEEKKKKKTWTSRSISPFVTWKYLDTRLIYLPTYSFHRLVSIFFRI